MLLETKHGTYTSGGAHLVPRVLHHKDQTGKAIMAALLDAVKQSPLIAFQAEPYGGRSDHAVASLQKFDRHLSAVHLRGRVCDADNASCTVETCLAKANDLGHRRSRRNFFFTTTNPKTSAGRRGRDGLPGGSAHYEYGVYSVSPDGALPSLRKAIFTERSAARRRSAELLTSGYQPFMHRYHERGSLAPRDVASRAIYQEMLRSESHHLWLDFTKKDPVLYLKERFSAIYAHCLEKGFRHAAKELFARCPRCPLFMRRHRCRRQKPDHNQSLARDRRGRMHRPARRQPARLGHRF